MGSGTKPKPSIELWGLTGGIASGKSSVAQILEQAGLPVIDADKISRDLSQGGGKAHPLIVKRFGTGDRAKLRKIVFDDPKARKDLEAILHPLIGEESRERIRELASRGAKRVIYEASLIIEAGRLEELEGLIVVEAPLESRLKWLKSRDGTSGENGRKILAAQLTDEKRRAHADYVITNDGSLDDLKRVTIELARKLHWIS